MKFSAVHGFLVAIAVATSPVSGCHEPTIRIKTDDFAEETSILLYTESKRFLKKWDLDESHSNRSLKTSYRFCEQNCFLVKLKDSYGDGVDKGRFVIDEGGEKLLDKNLSYNWSVIKEKVCFDNTDTQDKQGSEKHTFQLFTHLLTSRRNMITTNLIKYSIFDSNNNRLATETVEGIDFDTMKDPVLSFTTSNVSGRLKLKVEITRRDRQDPMFSAVDAALVDYFLVRDMCGDGKVKEKVIGSKTDKKGWCISTNYNAWKGVGWDPQGSSWRKWEHLLVGSTPKCYATLTKSFTPSLCE